MATEDSVAGAVGSKIGQYLIGQIGRQLGYLIHYKRNIENLMKQVEKLKEKRDELQLTVDEAIGNGDVIGPFVQGWLKSVDELCLKATNFYEAEVKENNGCLYGCCPNLKACYTLSKRAKKKTEKAAELQKGVFNRISYRAPPLAIGSTSMADFKSFESRVPTINEIVNLLKGDNVSMIGICGMGGLGKTTMVEEIARRVRAENLFDEVVMAVVSQNWDLMKIQDEFAYHLRMELHGKSSLSVRANCLQNRLKQSSKGNLIILDDVWRSLDLKEIGIPYGSESNNCKILLTSRSEDVCKVMGSGNIFKIEVLSEQEAWSLFRDMAGDCVDAPDLYLTASKVARECDGLPIAVITLGKALNDKRKEVWDDALIQLRKSILPTTLSEVEPKVYRSLQLSYDHLESKEAKSLFLLCCLFQEDTNIHLEDLVRYGVGLRLFDGIDLIAQARDRVLALTMKLKSCFLLLDGKKRFYVKLHDVVRDVGISIASKENHFNMKMIHSGEWPKVRDDAYKDCNALSVISHNISDLPSGGLDCPNLEVLQLACKELSLEALNSRNLFGGMTRLRVLDMWGMYLQSLPSSVLLLKQLRVLCLKDFDWSENICDFSKELGNLEILSIGCFPGNIECLTNLRLLDLRGCGRICIPPSVFSCLYSLEDLHSGDWVPDVKGFERGNATFNEMETLSKLTSLVIHVPHAKYLPTNPFLRKLKRYIIAVGKEFESDRRYKTKNCYLKKSLLLEAGCNDDAPLGGGIDYLLKQSTETLCVTGNGLKTVLDQLSQGGSTRLRILDICWCNEGVEYLVNTSTAEIGVFPKLEKLVLNGVTHLKEIYHGQQLPEGSFVSLQKIQFSNLPALTHLWEYQNVKLSNLRVVRVESCSALKNMFTLSVARSVVNLESLVIRRSSTMEEVISNQGPTGATTKTDGVELADIQKIEFPKLSKLLLFRLDSITCFSKGIDRINLPQLTELDIQYLSNLVSFCPDIPAVHSQSLFNHKVKMTKLKNLYFNGLDVMKEIWNDQLDDDSFHELKKVQVINCNGISTVLRCNMTRGFQKLEELRVHDCSLVEGVFEYGELMNNVGEDGHASVVVLPRLKDLHLHSLPMLTQLWKKHIRMNLDFKELSFIHIERCHSMKNVFSSSIVKALVKLQKLSIMDCEMVEQIIAKDHPAEGEASELSGMMEFKNLRSLSLKCLPNLTSVYFGWLSFPSLVELELNICSKMKMFSSSSVWDSKISRQPLFGNQVTFPVLKELQISGMPNIEELWCSQIPNESFQKVRFLEVLGCDKLVNVIPSHLLNVFSSLEELEVSECNSLEELFDSKGGSIGGGHCATLTETLKSIIVSECNHIRNLFPSSIAGGLVNLQLLKVESCPMIEDIIMEKMDGDGGEDRTLFPALKFLVLFKLPRLKSFFNVNYTVQIPALEKVIITDCSELTTFSSSLVSTPKLDSVYYDLWRTMCTSEGDLNKIIEQLIEEKVQYRTNLMMTGAGDNTGCSFDEVEDDMNEY